MDTKDLEINFRLFYNLSTGAVAITDQKEMKGKGANIPLGYIGANLNRFFAFQWFIGKYAQVHGKPADQYAAKRLYDNFTKEYKRGADMFPACAMWLIEGRKAYMHEIPAINAHYHSTEPITRLFYRHSTGE